MTQFMRRLFYSIAVIGLVLINFVAQPVLAVAPEDLSVLLSDSRPSTVTNVTITYDQSASGDFSAGDTLIVTFPTAWDTSSFASTDALDYDITNNAVEETLVDSGDSCTGDTIEITTVASDVFTFTACSGFVGEAAGTVLVIEIGTHATAGGTGNTQATTSTAATYTFTADATDEDAKDALVAVVAGVTISATVDESLTVAVNAVTAGANCDDNGGTPTEITTTNTTVPFGTISTETFYNGCQRIDVDTNAAQGYNVTIAQTQLLTSGGNTVAEGTCDGACSDTALGGWETATNNGFGYCADDRAGNAAADAGIASTDQCDDATPLYYTFFTDPTEPTVDFMFSSGPISGDQTNVSFHLSVPGDQAAGTYQNVVYYVATPTF